MLSKRFDITSPSLTIAWPPLNPSLTYSRAHSTSSTESTPSISRQPRRAWSVLLFPSVLSSFLRIMPAEFHIILEQDHTAH